MSLWSEFLTNDGRQIHKWVHYFPIYERHFNPFVNRATTFIEIGEYAPNCTTTGHRLPSIKILNCICIRSGADALTNLPNLGKVVPARGCGHFGNETGRTLIVSPPRMKPTEGFLCQNTNQVAERRSHLLHRRQTQRVRCPAKKE